VKFKLDENITVVAKNPLVALGHDVDTVPDENLTGRSDADVLSAAISEERALITFDLGFGDPRAYPPGSHASSARSPAGLRPTIAPTRPSW